MSQLSEALSLNYLLHYLQSTKNMQPCKRIGLALVLHVPLFVLPELTHSSLAEPSSYRAVPCVMPNVILPD